MDAAKEILKLLNDLLIRFGLVGVLVIVVLLIVHEPERAVKLKAIIFKPIFHLTRWGSKQYIGAKVSSQVTEFLRRNVTDKLSNRVPLTVKVKWVTSPSDPVLKRDGTVILRMRETADQTRNVLSATQLVLPFTVYPLLRSSLDRSVRTAIDLTILSKLALKLGTHARAVFQRYFLGPETEADVIVADLFKQLLELDEGGLFVSVFLEELEGMGDSAYLSADFVDRSDEVRALLTFLLGIARKEAGRHVDLDYHSLLLNIGVILVAKSSVAEGQGVLPYMSRLRRTLNEGCTTVYLLAYSHKESFLPRVMRAIEGEDRVTIEKQTVINIKENGSVVDHAKIVRLQRNTVYSDEVFQERLKLTEIKLGDIVDGIVTDVSQEQALVTIKGLNARILKQNCAWDSIVTCHDVLEIGDKRNFRVTAIRKDLGELQVSLRQVSDDPWKTNAIPKRDEVLEVIVVRDCGRGYLCKTDGGLEVTLPKSEVSWLTLTGTDKELSVDSRHDVVVYSINPDHRRIEVSMRRLENNPWPALAKRFSKGTKLRGKVIKTTPQFVHIDLGEGIIGGVPKDRMVAAGHEYASYEKSVVPGQGLDVVVTEVLVGNRIIKLDLQRNLAASPSVKQRTKTAGQK